MSRTTTEVLQDHLAKRLNNEVEKDIEANFAEDVVILSSFGVYEGHQGVRDSAKRLKEFLGKGTYHYKRVIIERDFGFLDWTGESDKAMVCDGADSYVVKDGKIVMQTIHYKTEGK